jgi:polyisoprenoid-binding protein YceI
MTQVVPRATHCCVLATCRRDGSRPIFLAMNKAIAMTLGGLLLVTSACDNDPAKGKAQAKVSEAAPDTAAAAAPGVSVSYAFSQAGSSIDWVGAKVTAKHDGKFNTFSGKVDVVDGDATKSSANVEIDLASVSSDTEKLTAHLKSPDFFDVAKFPKATFKTTQIKAGGEGGATHTVTGNLDLHGVTKAITFPATIKTSADAVQINAEFAINRKDFQIVYPGMANDLIKDEVLLKLKLDAKKS